MGPVPAASAGEYEAQGVAGKGTSPGLLPAPRWLPVLCNRWARSHKWKSPWTVLLSLCLRLCLGLLLPSSGEAVVPETHSAGGWMPCPTTPGS